MLDAWNSLNSETKADMATRAAIVNADVQHTPQEYVEMKRAAKVDADFWRALNITPHSKKGSAAWTKEKIAREKKLAELLVREGLTLSRSNAHIARQLLQRGHQLRRPVRTQPELRKDAPALTVESLAKLVGRAKKLARSPSEKK